MKKSLFIGVFLSEIAQKALISALEPAQKLWPEAHWIDPKKWHVTLYFAGEVDFKKNEAISQTIKNITSQQKYLNLYFSHLKIFENNFNQKHLVVVLRKSQALSNLAHHFRTNLDPILDKSEKQPFLPHITLIRNFNYSAEMPKFETEQRFEITAIELIESKKLESGSEYTVLKEFPLVSDKKHDEED